jgi:spermidine synthase
MTVLLGSIAFFLSGFAALVYQIVWQRLLVLPMGADVYSTTIIVGAFMAGLGCGSLAGGHIADRLARRRCLFLFIAAELAVGAFGLVSRYLYYDWMYFSLGSLSIPPVGMAGLVFLSLIWPTFWMGVSLPVLGRAVARSLEGAPRHVGLLYGLNTLGAATGAFATTWMLFPALGLAGSLQFAAALNALAAVAAGLMAALDRNDAGIPTPAVTDDGGIVTGKGGSRAAPTLEAGAWPFMAWAGLYAIAGFQALSLEIVWFRLLGVMVKSSAFTFGTLLTIYLAGLGAGAAVASVFLGSVRRPGRTFLLLQAFVGLYAGASLFLLVSMLPRSPALAAFWTYFGSYEPLDAASAFASLWHGGGQAGDRAQFFRLYILLPAVLVGPPTIAMGASFPLLQKIALTDLGSIGKRVGLVLLANIAGSAVGSIVTGWIALTYVGSDGSLKLLTGTSAIFLGLAVLAGRRATPRRRAAAVLAGACAIAATFALPDGSRLWGVLHGASSQRVVFAEDASGLSVLKPDPRGAMVFLNGIGQSWIPFGNIHSVLGALPAFIHPHPQEAVVIGLGSADTVYSLAGRPELRRVTCVEIIGPQLATLQAWANRTADPGLMSALADPRIIHVNGDGRAFIMRSTRSFDIVEADALRPTSAYSGNLYSLGYFDLLRSRLAPGGIAVTWAPTARIHDTFTAVFPHALSFGDILMGSNEPIRFEPAEIRARLNAPAVQEYYYRAGIDIEALLAPYLDRVPRIIGPFNRPSRSDLNEDLFPRDEFGVPYR